LNMSGTLLLLYHSDSYEEIFILIWYESTLQKLTPVF
jgi:hypothetical protein